MSRQRQPADPPNSSASAELQPSPASADEPSVSNLSYEQAASDASVAEAPGDGWQAPRAVAYTNPSAVPPSANNFSDPDLPYWLALNRIKGIGPARFRLLLDAFGSAEAVWLSEPGAWQAAGLDSRTTAAFVRQRPQIVPEAEVERLEKLHVTALRQDDAAYPRLLREIPQPPPLLYVRGALLEDDEWAVAIVGTRKATPYGRQVTERLAGELASQGVTIVSGLARGIDTAAHIAALDAGGRTIAVLGCGPDLVYPPENARLAARIVENGAIVTEFAPGTQPDAGNFPARNRIISGLSLGVLVTECPDDSGALITTRFAAEQGRDVFAVPGSIYNRSSLGANKLIQDGAKLVIEPNDVLSELNLHLVSAPQQRELRELLPENDTEAALLRLLDASGEPMHIDELCRASELGVPEVSGTLVMMELKGLVLLVGPMTYVRAR